MLGLRELKKHQTRQTIAEAAYTLFSQHGFDDVTVDDVAQAAQVSKKTVFNYFPTKEDLLFDRAEEREAALVAAVHDRPEGVTLLDSFRQLCLGQTRLIEGLRRKAGAGSGGVFDLVQSHPALLRKMHDINARLIDQLAKALAEQTGTAADDPLVGAVAATLIGSQRALYRSLRQRVASGASDAVIVRGHRRDVNRVFDQLEAGLGSYP
ncbi:MAG: TetR family transcriptional regulator [Frankiales bacterium]|nr:TetR family transcriptional regulator [Frankiales bacterium]